jgi:hypothetical protein
LKPHSIKAEGKINIGKAFRDLGRERKMLTNKLGNKNDESGLKQVGKVVARP